MDKIFILKLGTATIGALFLYGVAAGADPYEIISKKNLFRPDREEWVLDVPDSMQVDKKVDTSKLELYGTIIVGDKRSALIKDKDVKKNKVRGATGRNKSKKMKATAAKAEIYSLGDYIGGYVISEIEEKKVVLDYYGEKVTLNLHEGKEPTKGDYTPLADERSKRKNTPKPKPTTRNKRRKNRSKSTQQKMEEQLAAGQIPEALANSPFMSQENMKKLLDFNKEIMEELKESGGELDQSAIKERVEQFRNRFMGEMGGG